MNLVGGPSDIRQSKLEALYSSAQRAGHQTLLDWIVYSTHSLGRCQAETETRQGLSHMAFAASQIDGTVEELSHVWHMKSALACFVFHSPDTVLEVHREDYSREQSIVCDGHNVWDLLTEMQQHPCCVEKSARKGNSNKALQNYVARNILWESLNDR
jgi:hypothetical protein